MQRNIITINREFGSGGGEIARLMGEKLGMKVYDRSMLDCIAKQFDMTVENIERVKAQKTNWWSDFCRFYKQFGAASHTPNKQTEVTPLSIFYAESRVLRSLAEEEDCIIVGRAGFHIFRDYPNALHLLIRAKREARIARIAQKQNLSLDEAAKLLDKVDEARDTYVKNVANTSRYDVRNYDFTFNITGMQPEKVAEFLAENVRHKIEMNK
jgi:cytidylate kinase